MKNRYKQKYSKVSRKGRFKVITICFTLLLLAGVVITGSMLFCYLNERDAVISQDHQSLINAYQATACIKQGQVITDEELRLVELIPNMPESYYFSQDMIGQIAIAEIAPEMILTSNMCRKQDLMDQEREVECEIITLSQNLSENDYVDVRLMMPNGEDYIVLSKKSIHGIQELEEGALGCYLWMSEHEILYYSAAIVDAYLYQGASLYTTRYIEPTVQNPSEITYTPSIATLTMMKENPNLLHDITKQFHEDERKRMENRLTDYLNKNIREVKWEEASYIQESNTPASAFVNESEDRMEGMVE